MHTCVCPAHQPGGDHNSVFTHFTSQSKNGNQITVHANSKTLVKALKSSLVRVVCRRRDVGLAAEDAALFAPTAAARAVVVRFMMHACGFLCGVGWRRTYERTVERFDRAASC